MDDPFKAPEKEGGQVVQEPSFLRRNAYYIGGAVVATIATAVVAWDIYTTRLSTDIIPGPDSTIKINESPQTVDEAIEKLYDDGSVVTSERYMKTKLMGKHGEIRENVKDTYDGSKTLEIKIKEGEPNKLYFEIADPPKKSDIDLNKKHPWDVEKLKKDSNFKIHPP